MSMLNILIVYLRCGACQRDCQPPDYVIAGCFQITFSYNTFVQSIMCAFMTVSTLPGVCDLHALKSARP